MIFSPPGTTEPDAAGSPSHTDIAAAAWGVCRIRLLADRAASRTGAAHKDYRGWRFAVAMEHGSPESGMTLLTIPIDPNQLAASHALYALVQVPHQGVIAVGETAAFSWSTTSTRPDDPFAKGITEVRRQLERDGWRQDAMLPTRYRKTGQTVLGGDAVASPSLTMATPLRPEDTGLDDWETDGGTSA